MNGTISVWIKGVLTCWAFVMVGVLVPRAVPFLLAGLGWYLTRSGMARLTTDRVCVRVACWSYLLKIALAFLLYYASYDGWPLLKSYQGERGFWVFAEDALAYHNHAHNLSLAWSGLAPFPQTDVSNWSFIVYMGLLYLVVGSQPLAASVLNAWWGSLIVGAGLVMLRRWAVSPGAVRLGVALLGFWPSLLLWSSQPMKDPLVLALIMLALSAILLTVDVRPLPRPLFVRRLSMLLVLLVVSSLFRSYVGLQLMIVTALIAGSTISRLLRRAEHSPATVLLALVAVLAPMTTILAMQINVREFVVPLAQHPKVEAVTVSASTSPTPVVPDMPSQPQTAPGPSAAFPRAVAQRPVESRGQGFFHRFVAQLFGIMAYATLDSLDTQRSGFVMTGGYSLMDPDKRFRSVFEALAYVPRGLSIAVLAPFPSQWFDVSGRTRAFRSFTAVEAALVYWLVVGFLLRIGEVRRLGMQPAAVLLFVVLSAVPMALVVANLGTLFRLRLQFLLPLVTLLCGVDVWMGYRTLFQRIAGSRGELRG